MIQENVAPGAPRARRATTSLAIALAVLVVALDQLSKWWIVAVLMQPPRVVPLTPFLNFVLIFNRGASFGVFRHAGPWGPWILSAFAIAISLWLFRWQWRAGRPWIAAAVGFIVGGALGNVIDRLAQHAVTDFIDVYYGTLHFWTFNLADSAITVGVVLLLGEALFGGRESPNT